MSIATPTTTDRAHEESQPGRVPARTGNANVRALLDLGIHPASERPLYTDPALTTPHPDDPTGTILTRTHPHTGTPELAPACGNCALALVHLLTRTDPATPTAAGNRLKCAAAPVSHRGRWAPASRSPRG